MTTPTTTVSTVDIVSPGAPGPITLHQQPPPRATGLALWVEAAGEAQTIARALVQSFFVPQAYKPNIPPRASQEEVNAALEVAIANATGAILLGQSLSTPSFEIDPLTALQNIYVVHGRPGMYAKFKVGLAQAHGHRVTDIEYGPESVTVEGQRKGTDQVVRVTITMDDAKRAGWATPTSQYSKVPADMLWARAASRVVDRIASDALFGIASLEELETDEPAASVAPARVTVEDVAARAAVVAAVEAVRQPDGEPDAAVEMIDERTWKLLNAEWVRLDIIGPGMKDRRLRGISTLVGHPVEAGSTLTAAEADVVLSTLQGLRPTEHREHLVRLCEILGEPVPAEAPAPAGDDVPPPSDEEIAAAAERTAPAGAEPPGWDGLR